VDYHITAYGRFSDGLQDCFGFGGHQNINSYELSTFLFFQLNQPTPAKQKYTPNSALCAYSPARQSMIAQQALDTPQI
jgi:hypothetical protein